MDEKLKILELIREGKVTPEQGLELLDAIGTGGAPNVVRNFVGVSPEPARHLRITSLSRKGNEVSFNIPLGVVRFAYNLFPGRLKFTVNQERLDLEEIMDRVYKEEKGIIYQDDAENVTFEMV